MPDVLRQSKIGNTGVYLVQRGTEFAVVDPLRGKACVCNETAARQIASVFSGECTVEDILSENVSIFIRELDASPEYHFRNTQESNGDYRPTAVTLDLTPNCTLCCTYCYASAGTLKGQMDWSCAKASIKFICDNSLMLGVKPRITFHGSGEPTCAWNLLVRCVEYFRQLCKDAGVQGHISMSTNGCYSAKKTCMDYVRGIQCEFVLRHT